MVKLYVKRVTPEGISLEGEESPEILDIGSEGFIKCTEPIRYVLKAFLVNNGILVQGKIKARLNCKCGLCLKNYDFDISLDNICYFYEKPDKSEIDLKDDIREDILLSFPQNLKCSESCKGLCIYCGQDLNFTSCACRNNNLEDNWGELDKLKF